MAESRKLFESLPAVVNNTLIQEIKKEASRLRAQSAELSSRYTARHPQVLSINANLEVVENQIRNETDKRNQILRTVPNPELQQSYSAAWPEVKTNGAAIWIS